MATIDKTYHEILSDILRRGYEYEDPNRKGVFRKEIFSTVLRHDLLNEGFPAITTKEIYFKGAVGELLFFLSGSTDIRHLWKRGVRFWDKDWARFHGFSDEITKGYYQAWKKVKDNPHQEIVNSLMFQDKNYDMGAIYPKQYRDFGGVDQIVNLVNTMKCNPMSTSLIVNAWNVGELKEMCLPPCHYGFQILMRPLRLDQRLKSRKQYLDLKEMGKYPDKNEYLDKQDLPKYGFELHWTQRSTDVFLGTGVNVIFYSLLAKILEKLTGHVALAVQGDLKNVHLYDNQIAAAKEQLKRNTEKYSNCKIEFSENFNYLIDKYSGAKEDLMPDNWNESEAFTNLINNLSTEDFKLVGYDSYEKISVPMLPYSK